MHFYAVFFKAESIHKTDHNLTEKKTNKRNKHKLNITSKVFLHDNIIIINFKRIKRITTQHTEFIDITETNVIKKGKK